MNIGLSAVKVWSLLIDPLNPTTIYAGTIQDGVFKSTDGGDSWMNIGLVNLAIYNLAIDPLNFTAIYAGTNDGVFKLSVEIETP